MQALLILNLLMPFIMVLVGAELKRHPVSDWKSQNGYSTRTSRKSQAHWDYAQQIAPEIFISLGKYLFVMEIVVSVLLFIFKVSVIYAVGVGTCIGFVWLGCGFYLTDKKIKEKFSGR